NVTYQISYPDTDRPTPPSDLLTIVYTEVGGVPVEAPIKKGGFIFDPTNCLWYRVLNILHEDPAYIAVQLERPAEAATAITSVIVPEGVINVFPLPSRVDQSRLDKARRVSR